MDDNNLELSSVERLTLIHRKLVLVYIGYLYPIRIFKQSFFSMEKVHPAMFTTLVA